MIYLIIIVGFLPIRLGIGLKGFDPSSDLTDTRRRREESSIAPAPWAPKLEPTKPGIAVVP